jgi:hypothetical protein
VHARTALIRGSRTLLAKKKEQMWTSEGWGTTAQAAARHELTGDLDKRKGQRTKGTSSELANRGSVERAQIWEVLPAAQARQTRGRGGRTGAER